MAVAVFDFHCLGFSPQSTRRAQRTASTEYTRMQVMIPSAEILELSGDQYALWRHHNLLDLCCLLHTQCCSKPDFIGTHSQTAEPCIADGESGKSAPSLAEIYQGTLTNKYSEPFFGSAGTTSQVLSIQFFAQRIWHCCIGHLS
jgi:hypothetical protein